MPFSAVTEAQCVSYILDEIAAGRGGWVVTTNLDHLRRSQKDREFLDLSKSANLVVADGMPIVWASRLQGAPLPERVAGSNLIWSLTAGAAQRGYSIFLLGGDPGTADGAAGVLKRRNPTLQIAGTYCPPLGFEDCPAEKGKIRHSLICTRPDIVYVALGSPKQELAILEYRDVQISAWWLGVGISFSFVSGNVRRAPKWMQCCGLEWIHRWLQEPSRLTHRYLVQGIPFAIRLLVNSAKKRNIHSHPSQHSPNV